MNSIKIDNDIFIEEPADVYHAKAGEYLSSHQLMDFMKCPLLYYKKRAGDIQDRQTSSFLVGQAAHVRILEGRGIYERQFALGGPINPTTGKPYGSLTKKFAQWRDEQKKPVLTFDQMETIEQMACGVALNENAVDLISEGFAERVVRALYRDTPCQIRMDWFNPCRGIVDLKSCDDLTWFEADARRYRYHNQVAFYQSVFHAATGFYVPVHLIAIEKKQPFRTGVWRISENTLTIARQENEIAMKRLQECHQSHNWPTLYEEIREFEIA